MGKTGWFGVLRNNPPAFGQPLPLKCGSSSHAAPCCFAKFTSKRPGFNLGVMLSAPQTVSFNLLTSLHFPRLQLFFGPPELRILMAISSARCPRRDFRFVVGPVVPLGVYGWLVSVCAGPHPLLHKDRGVASGPALIDGTFW